MIMTLYQVKPNEEKTVNKMKSSLIREENNLIEIEYNEK